MKDTVSRLPVCHGRVELGEFCDAEVKEPAVHEARKDKSGQPIHVLQSIVVLARSQTRVVE